MLIAAEVLQPSVSTTTLTMMDGDLRVQDGPFADTKEQLGGTFVLDVPDLDAALEWAGRRRGRVGRGRDPAGGDLHRRRRLDRQRVSAAEVRAAADRAARASYGRLVALLAASDA